MKLINLVNDCIKEYGKQDVANCKQQIINAAQNEISLVCNNPYLTDEQKFCHISRIYTIADNLLAQQNKRDFLLEAAGFLNELSKLVGNDKK